MELDAVSERDANLLGREHLIAAADVVADAVIFVDRSCAIRYVNAGAEWLFGAPRERMLGIRCEDGEWKLLAADGSEVPVSEHACLVAMETGKIIRGEERTILRSDGSRAAVLASATPVRDATGGVAGVLASYTDITALKEAEDALLAASRDDASLLRLYSSLGAARSYAEILEALEAEVPTALGYSSVWLCVIDDPKQARLVLAGGAGAAHSAESIMELGERYRGGVGEDRFVVLPIQGDAMMEEIFEGTHIVVVEDGRTDPRANKEIVAVSDNRTIINAPLRLSDRLMGVLGTGTFGDEGPRPPTPAQLKYLETLGPHVAVAMDRINFLTERVQTQADLEVSEQRYRRFVETSIEGVWEIDSDYRTTFVSGQMAKLLDCEPDEPLGRPVFDFIFDEDIPTVKEQLVVLRKGRPAMFEMRAHGCDGPARWLQMSASPILADDGAFLGAFAMVADIAARKLAEFKLDAAVERLNGIVDGVVLALASTTSNRDPYTANHQERVATLACAIAEEMGFSAEFVKGIRIAGQLHDIGKLAVPSEILSKPGVLSDLEMEIVRTHAEVGYHMLEHVEFGTPVALTVRQHHERLDGSGYPRGLRGSEILPEARIIAVADVVEAMASHRPYRPGCGWDAALQEVASKAGSAFDADAVEACMRVVPGILATLDRAGSRR